MAIRKIAQMGEPVLRNETRELELEELASPEVQRLIDDMIETMHDAGGVGIAAPQVYEPIRLCVMELGKNARYPDLPELPITVLVNPVVEFLVDNPEQPAPEDTVTMYEGCLSVQGIRGKVKRPRKVRVLAVGRRGEPIEMLLEGPLASVVQHETDHLHGVLFIDRAEPKSLTFLREYDRHVPPADRVHDGGA
ncbi:MAG TPA: peptide deformylase [Polyangiaceae bacterium]|jgi:peptide deformylase|nr:peptide deformylase [Polyangiaceae bacterium]